jgi:hypothetical protein
MHKIKPFRQYDEKDVINLFALDHSGLTLSDLKPGVTTTNNGVNWSGTVLKVDTTKANFFAQEPGGLTTGTTHAANSYLGAIGSDDQGNASKFGSFYPEAPMKLDAGADDDANPLGIALRPTLAFDENDEKLLYYSRKKDELQCVLPGETVPVATRGLFVFEGPSVSAGDKLGVGANGVIKTYSAGAGIGQVLAVGTKNSVTTSLVLINI